MKAAEYIGAVCLVLPSGETIWFEEAKGHEYMRQTIDKWKADHPEFADTPCNMGAVNLTMPRDVLDSIGTNRPTGQKAG